MEARAACGRWPEFKVQFGLLGTGLECVPGYCNPYRSVVKWRSHETL